MKKKPTDEDQLRRAQNLVKQILAFNRQQEEIVTPMQIAPVIKEVLTLLRSTLPATIEIRKKIEPEIGNIMADPTRIHQIIMILCTNAGHAMQEKGGILEVNLAKIRLDKEFVREHPGLRPGEFLRLSVSDTGHGIAPEILNKIFDPCFTTKKRGEETGPGLAGAHGIVQTYGGAMTVYSEPGQGAVFHVYLPIIQEAVEPKPDKPRPVPGENERILFVDDEISISKIAKRVLEQLGYRVETRTDPVEVLELFRTDPNRFDLIITDMTMPKMKGDRLAQEIMKIRADIPVILCTGFGTQMEREKAMDMGIRAFVLKPIIMRDLAKIIRDVLDRKKY